jgi:Holliday junction resolvase
MNKQYQKGVRFEREIVNLARKNNLIAFRSAGSHSPIDVTIIDPIARKIWFYQAKKQKRSQKALKSKFKVFENLSDEYFTKFNLVTNIKEIKEDLILNKL